MLTIVEHSPAVVKQWPRLPTACKFVLESRSEWLRHFGSLADHVVCYSYFVINLADDSLSRSAGSDPGHGQAQRSAAGAAL